MEYAERFSKAYGVDVSRYAIEKAAQRLRSPKLCIQDAARRGFKSGYFDVITGFDILEHMDHPELAIEDCIQVLKEGCILVISVPNMRSYGLSWKKSKWHGYRDSSHVSLLSNEKWIELLEANNFEIVANSMTGSGTRHIFRRCLPSCSISSLRLLLRFSFLFWAPWISNFLRSGVRMSF